MAESGSHLAGDCDLCIRSVVSSFDGSQFWRSRCRVKNKDHNILE